MNPADLMRLAIDKARQGLALGQSPFGCAIARGDQLIACEHNGVRLKTDITAHAEINALRAACKETQHIFFEGAIVATTCEPCPMCMAALHWARVEKVYFGASIADATAAGFNELRVDAAELCRLGRSPVQLVPGLLADECRALFDQWKARPDRLVY